MITMESRLGEVYATTVGHDAFYKVLLQLGISEKIILNSVSMRLTLLMYPLSAVMRFSASKAVRI